LADELRTLYPQFQQKIADLFARIATNDKQIIDLHGR
jgi:adenylate kinase